MLVIASDQSTLTCASTLRLDNRNDDDDDEDGGVPLPGVSSAAIVGSDFASTPWGWFFM